MGERASSEAFKWGSLELTLNLLLAVVKSRNLNHRSLSL